MYVAHPASVQRLFSMFPTGLPGLALILLRASVAVAILGDVFTHQPSLSSWIQATAMTLAAILLAGFWTPILAVVGLVFHGLIWSNFGVGTVASATVVSLDAVALALLGPGAYSVDSYRFGRRVLLLPPS